MTNGGEPRFRRFSGDYRLWRSVRRVFLTFALHFESPLCYYHHEHTDIAATTSRLGNIAVAMENNAHMSDQETIRNVSKTRKMFKQPGTFSQAVLNVISTPLEEGLSESTAVLGTALGILDN